MTLESQSHRSLNEADKFLDHLNSDRPEAIQPAELAVSLPCKHAWPRGFEGSFHTSQRGHRATCPILVSKVAIVGTGISGLSAAWLLSHRHDVTVYERADRSGGHSNTILASVGSHCIPVDTGFIVFNRHTYPNLTALFELLKVPTSGIGNVVCRFDGWRCARILRERAVRGFFGQPRNLISPRFVDARGSGPLLPTGVSGY